MRAVPTMLSQQQNPPEISHSLHQQIGLNGNGMQADIGSFSIRQFVLASRQNDILRSWPFPEKYLQICFKHGIRNVLPPLEPRDSAIQSLRGCAKFKFSEQDIEKTDSFDNKAPDSVEQEKLVKDECDSYSHEELSKVSGQDCNLSLSSNSYKLEEKNSDIPSVDKNSKSQISSKGLRHKRKRYKGKRKKRSMVDILAIAKHCNLEDLHRINRILGCGSAKPPEHGGEQNGGMVDIESNSKSELTDECLDKKFQGDHDCEAANVNMSREKQWVLKFKFSGCKPK
ncbi:uncharacterized protein LOC132179587 [Corylus avellana]|uniref:uncharacterized protein LOC132179587 n=1 Tax=Corylus avellana TaxID=13451 RepID=UPI00286B5739|nr:uncharacterized protein LOC132179587 [Corylus avellana]